MSVPFYIEHGKTKFLELPGLEIAKRQRSLDSIRRTIRTDSEDTFREGGTLQGFPHMRLKEVVSKQDGPGWMHELLAEGLRRGPHKLESSSLSQPEEGFDSGPQTWLTTKPDDFAIGLVHPDIASLWCVGIENKENLNGHVWRVTPDYKGYIPDALGNPKPATWKVTVNGQNMSTSAAVNLGHATPEIFTAEDGVTWNGFTGQKAAFDVSKVNLVETLISTTPPRTDRVGMSLTPAYIPAISNIFDSPAWFAVGFTYNYPAGWKLAGVQSQRVLDKEIYLYTNTYEYNPVAVPTL